MTTYASMRSLSGRTVARRAFQRFPFWFVPVAAITFGGTMLVPGYSFAGLKSFSAMNRVGTAIFGAGNAEQGWGILIATVGAMQLMAGLFLSRARVPLLLLWALSIIYAGIAGSFVLSAGFRSTGTGQYGLTALLAVWAFVHWES